jgi:hypothetical protein
MRTSFWATLNRSLRNAKRWYETTPERALDLAYDAALMIKAIEDEYFGGNKIPTESSQYSQNTLACFQADLKNYLKIAQLRLSEFKTSRRVFSSTDFSANARSGPYASWNRENSAAILEKLKFIDAVLDRYRTSNQSVAIVPVAEAVPPQSLLTPETQSNQPINGKPAKIDRISKETDGILDKTGVLPRSIVGTLNRIRRDLDPNSEGQVVENFRNTKAKTLISIRFLLLLIIVPLLTQQLSKTLVVAPIVNYFRTPNENNIFLNFELEEEALHELQIFKERLEFDQLLPKAPEISEPQKSGVPSESTTQTEVDAADTMEEKLQEKVKEIAEFYYKQGSNAINNVFADILAAMAFAIVIITNRREVEVLKSFIDETVYGLSDSAKAFIIILLTDIFVGFHSPHGWEILLESAARHLGLPASRDFIFLFIATFPVILDTIFKYWIFRYLNRISPSAVATYRNMNE